MRRTHHSWVLRYGCLLLPKVEQANLSLDLLNLKVAYSNGPWPFIRWCAELLDSALRMANAPLSRVLDGPKARIGAICVTD